MSGDVKAKWTNTMVTLLLKRCSIRNSYVSDASTAAVAAFNVFIPSASSIDQEFTRFDKLDSPEQENMTEAFEEALTTILADAKSLDAECQSQRLVDSQHAWTSMGFGCARKSMASIPSRKRWLVSNPQIDELQDPCRA